MRKTNIEIKALKASHDYKLETEINTHRFSEMKAVDPTEVVPWESLDGGPKFKLQPEPLESRNSVFAKRKTLNQNIYSKISVSCF